MKILTLENSAYDIDCVPNEIEDIRYCVFDAGDTEFQDYYWLPLNFPRKFSCSCNLFKHRRIHITDAYGLEYYYE